MNIKLEDQMTIFSSVYKTHASKTIIFRKWTFFTLSWITHPLMQEQVNITVPVNKICLVYADGLMNPARKFDIYPVQKKSYWP